MCEVTCVFGSETPRQVQSDIYHVFVMIMYVRSKNAGQCTFTCAEWTGLHLHYNLMYVVVCLSKTKTIVSHHQIECKVNIYRDTATNAVPLPIFFHCIAYIM